MLCWVYTEQCGRMWTRYWIFLFTQLAFMVIEENYSRNSAWRMQDRIAVTACACVVASLWSSGLEALRMACGRRLFRGDDMKWVIGMQSVGSGVGLLVIAYSANGMAWLPQLSMGACLGWGCFSDGRPPEEEETDDAASDTTRVSFGSTTAADRGACTGVLLAVGLMGLHYASVGKEEWGMRTVWLGILLPAVAAIVMCKCSRTAMRRGGRQSDIWVSMPALGLISMTVLSLYGHTRDTAPRVELDNSSHRLWNWGASGLNSSLANFVYYQGMSLLNLSATIAPPAFNATALPEAAWLTDEASALWRTVLNQTIIHYRVYLSTPTDEVLSLSGVEPPPNAGTGVACIAAPVLLWGTLSIFSAAFGGGTARSAVVVWLLASATHSAWRHGLDASLVAAVALLNVVLLFHVLPDEVIPPLRLRTYEYTDAIEDDEDEEVNQPMRDIASRSTTHPDSDV